MLVVTSTASIKQSQVLLAMFMHGDDHDLFEALAQDPVIDKMLLS